MPQVNSQLVKQMESECLLNQSMELIDDLADPYNQSQDEQIKMFSHIMNLLHRRDLKEQ